MHTKYDRALRFFLAPFFNVVDAADLSPGRHSIAAAHWPCLRAAFLFARLVIFSVSQRR